MKRLQCLLMGHRWGPWGDNGCYLTHEGGTAPDFHEHWFTSWCKRCWQMRSQNVQSPIGEPTRRPA